MKNRSPQNSNKSSELIISNENLINLLLDTINKGNRFRFKAEGYSMSPFIKTNDVLTISPIKKKPGIGDIVAVKHSNNKRLVIHRIVGRKNSSFLIKGDNNENSFDGYFPEKDLIGIVTEIKRKNKIIKNYIHPVNYIIALMSRTNILPGVKKIMKFLGVRRQK